MATIADIVAGGKAFGIFDFYLPFIIMFALFFGVLKKISIFGDDKSARTINVILAGAMSLFVMIYTPAGVTLSGFLAQTFGETMVAIITILVVLLVVFVALPAFGIKPEELGKGKEGTKRITVILILIALIGLGIFISSNGLSFFGINLGQLPGVQTPVIWFPSISGLSSQDLAIIVLGVATIGVMIWLATSGKDDKNKNKENKPAT